MSSGTHSPTTKYPLQCQFSHIRIDRTLLANYALAGAGMTLPMADPATPQFRNALFWSQKGSAAFADSIPFVAPYTHHHALVRTCNRRRC